MSKIVRTVRFLAGTAMVAGGVSLASPFVGSVVVAHSRSGRPVAAPAAMPSLAAQDWPSAGFGGQPGPQSAQQPFFATPQGQGMPGMNAAGHGMGPDGQLATAVAMAVPSAASRQEYRPPQPPAPLPGAPADGSAAMPGLDQTYRSTLDIPPPPLLDAQSPPPLAVAWSAHDLREAGGPPPSAFVAAAPAAVAMPSIYTVRDGDDLTGIATRLYGHPGAAAAIWSANRDRLANPDLLPIGLQLRVPPAWTVSALQHTGGNGGPPAIEPGPAVAAAEDAARMRHPVGDGMAANAGGTVMPVDRPHPGWLGQPARPASPAFTTTAFSPVARADAGQPAAGSAFGGAAGQQPRSVRVAPGDTLVTLAERFYGDRAMAERIWLANRDRLRSPELLVPGTDLRLP